MIRVISIDPGVHTGYCYAKIIDGVLEYYPFQAVDDVDDLWRRLFEFKPRIIVMEKWEDRLPPPKMRAYKAVNSFPQQLIGVARLYANHEGEQCGIYLQTPSQGLGGFYSQKMLKNLGLLKRGDITNLAHGLSATQHLLQWAHFGGGGQYITEKRNFATRLDEWNG